MNDVNRDHAGLEILSSEECRRRLGEASVARVAVIDHGEPIILPVNVGMWEHAVVFSTAAGSKLDAALMRQPVAIEIDGIEEDSGKGWSVLVKGVADLVTDGPEVESLDALGVPRWVGPEVPRRWVSVRIDEISGRRTPAPAR